MPLGRQVRAFLTEAKYESLGLLRTPAFSIPILLLPIFFYMFFGVLIAGSRGAGQYANYAFIGWTIYGVIGPGLFGFGILLATERDQGLLAFKRALPMPPAAYLLAKLAMAVVFGLIIMAMITAAGVLIGGVTIPAGRLAAVGLVAALGVIPACAIGLFIGAWSPSSAAPAAANMVYLAMSFLSGLFFPLPEALQPWRVVWPTYHLMQLTLAAGGAKSQGDPLTHIAVVAGVTILLIALAARRLARAG
jgi:ABC-2 type transport system permease protein